MRVLGFVFEWYSYLTYVYIGRILNSWWRMSVELKVLPIVDRLPEPLRRFMDRLTPEQKLLLVLKRELYDGEWSQMIVDLENRKNGRPHVLRLANRIEDDLGRIEQMRKLEEHYEVELTSFLEALPDEESSG